MNKRTYGTGTLRELPSGKWLFEYKPKWALKRQSTTIDACHAKIADKRLTDWVTELDAQQGPSVEVSITTLIDLHIADMRLSGCDPDNIAHVERRARKHLGSYFKDFDFAKPLKKAFLKRYAEARLKAGAARATINRERSALRRAIQLGIDEELICVPVSKFEKLDENNIRTGFIEDEAYRSILAFLPDHQKMLWCFAYYLGVRQGELLKIRTEWLLPYWKLAEPYIKIPGYDANGKRVTKSGKPHTIPLYHKDLRAFVEMALAKLNPKCPYLFQYRGSRLSSIHTGFAKACDDAGYPDVFFHDTRRTAVRRMEEAGIPRRKAMQITGHLTEAVYKRYDIGTEADATEAGVQLRDHEEKFANRFANDSERSRPAVPATASRNMLN